MDYFDWVGTFLLAARTSDWLLLLHTVSEMLPVNYAKAAHIYISRT